MATKIPRRPGGPVQLKVDNLAQLVKNIRELIDMEILVGVPEEHTEREPDEEAPEGMTNAALAYIHDNGAPEANIPARPFMIPGLESVRDQVADRLEAAAKVALVLYKQPRGVTVTKSQAVNQRLHRAGLVAQNGIRKKIREGIPPPLAEYTLKKRAAKGRKGAAKELENRAQGLPPGMDLATPLMDTGEMLKSITYVIRSRRRRQEGS